ncbi:MAG: hypothetical protein LBS19_16585 [Clostridiales bacterium]|nr:hypothetical protein [Clostridiales bacterium]
MSAMISASVSSSYSSSFSFLSPIPVRMPPMLSDMFFLVFPSPSAMRLKNPFFLTGSSLMVWPPYLFDIYS